MKADNVKLRARIVVLYGQLRAAQRQMEIYLINSKLSRVFLSYILLYQASNMENIACTMHHYGNYFSSVILQRSSKLIKVNPQLKLMMKHFHFMLHLSQHSVTKEANIV